jgi:hypothetical protein
MEWHFVNAMTFETATHRVRRVCAHDGEGYWLAERKVCCDDHAARIPGRFDSMEFAQSACERDTYGAVASGS